MANSERTPSSTGPSLIGIAQTFAAYFAIPIALFYPIGFLALWIQIYHYAPGLRLETAWHGVSLVHRVTIIGQGIQVLLGSLVFSLVFAMLFSNLFYFLHNIYTRRQRISDNTQSKLRTVLVTVLALGCVCKPNEAVRFPAWIEPN